MKVYTVYAPPDRAANTDRADQLAFVKDGFIWPALFLPGLWLVWHRMWLALILWLSAAGAVATALAVFELPASVSACLGLLFAVWFAVQAGDFRRAALERASWRIVGLATGRNHGEAEHGFLARWLPAVHEPERRLPPRSSRRTVAPSGSPDDDVIGLFQSPR